MTRSLLRTLQHSILPVAFAAAACAKAPNAKPAPAPVPADAAQRSSRDARAVDTAFSGPQRAVVVRPDQQTVDALIAEGMQRSHAGADLEYLTDVIGPRLTASASLKRANDWTAQKFQEYGMTNVHLEPWKFGQRWTRGPAAVRMTAPHERWLNAVSWAWAPGTNGPSAGDVVYMNATTRADFDARFAGKLRGKWVLSRGPVTIWNPDGPPMTSADSVRLDSLRRAQFATPASPFRDSVIAVLAGEGIAGYITSGAKQYGLETMSGSPARIYPFPYIVVDNETFSQMHRLLGRGERVALEANIQNTLGSDSVAVYNTVAEIRGTERPDEVVLLGAHLDSWDMGTGATDNGAGSIAVLEAARILQATGARPRRTIRFVLFSGEEEGLYGSRMYARDHAAELPKFQSVLVLDNGTGHITGMALQGRNELRDMWTSLFAPTSALGPFKVRPGNKGGTDHLSFLPYGVPGFNYDQESRGYDHTHHSQIDTFDHAVIPDLMQAATVMAVNAWQLANLDELLPRGTVTAPR
ncbi:MAG: M20/M25/M40 family metallo-hydrolase [Gemmatimonadaceae bacterium]